ncbi:membrane protein [Photobacterium aquae]|uniref:Membrane protein n=1 Tax=Photobacterium aquae TaxID=1195763 RepID=A0A0J1JUI8_9GAMM|nr:hypothetical protein [Photobacterium aquae]KLV05967.1 membrane protein [Photobacterium aquae]
MDHSRKGLNRAAQLLAALVVVCLLRYADSFAIIFSFMQLGVVPSMVTALILLSGVFAIVGLCRAHRWGFIPLYFFIPAVTLFFGYSLIPFLPLLFVPEVRQLVILLSNSAVMLFSVMLLLKMMDTDVVLPKEKY